MNAKVWVLGDAVVDLLPESEGRLLQCPGGAPANVAAGVARLGGNSGFIGRVGDDPFTALCAIPCNRSRSTSVICTSTASIAPPRWWSTLTTRANEPLPLWCAPARIYSWLDSRSSAFAANQWLHVCSIALSAEPSRSTTFAAMEKIKLAGGRVSFDPNIRPDLWQDQDLLHACLDRALRLANVVKLSEEELVFISGSNDITQGIANVTERYQPELLLVTQGKAGVLAAFQQQFTHFSAKPVISVDTTGAGDVVAGPFASLAVNGMLTDINALEPTLTLAAKPAAHWPQRAKGAMTALPYQRDLNRQF